MAEILDAHCPLCANRGAHRFHEIDGFVIVQCATCSLLYVHPLPSDAHLNAHYQKQSYFEGDAAQGYRNYSDMEKALRPHFRRRLQRIRAYLPTGGRLLDFGCAAGYFLEVARDEGWKVSGVELSESMAEQARNRTGAPVATSLAQLPAEPFDAITLWEVVEHLPRPVETISALVRRLRPGGILMLSTPNTGHWQARRRPERWGGFRPPSHLTFLTAADLLRLLKAAGLAQIDIWHTAPLPPLPGWLDAATADLQAGLADGTARPWPVALAAWRSVRGAAWAWQRVANGKYDIFATLEAAGVKPETDKR